MTEGYVETSAGLQVDSGPEWEPTPWADLPGERDDMIRAQLRADRKPLPTLDVRQKVGGWTATPNEVDGSPKVIAPRNDGRRSVLVANLGPAAVELSPMPMSFAAAGGLLLPAGERVTLETSRDVYAVAQGALAAVGTPAQPNVVTLRSSTVQVSNGASTLRTPAHEWVRALFQLQVTVAATLAAGGAAAPTLDVFVEDSADDGATWNTLVTFARVGTALAREVVRHGGPMGTLLRVRWAVGGDVGTGWTFNVVATPEHPNGASADFTPAVAGGATVVVCEQS